MTHSENTPASTEAAVALAPDINRLDSRAAKAWTEKMAVSPLGEGKYLVVGQDDTAYEVDLTVSRCTCPDHTYRRTRCKHIRRVALEVTRDRIPAPNHRAVTCLACGERAFVRTGEPPVCESCQFTPGTTVRDRETGDLLVVVEQTGQRADCVVIRDGTVADYSTNVGYPHGDPVVWCVYPFSGSIDQSFEERQRYAFPHARLEREWRPNSTNQDQNQNQNEQGENGNGTPFSHQTTLTS
jgi:hypothetical protein